MLHPTSENALPHVCGSRREMTRRRPDSVSGFRKWQSSTALRSIKNHPCTLTFVSRAISEGRCYPSSQRGVGSETARRSASKRLPARTRRGLPVARARRVNPHKSKRGVLEAWRGAGPRGTGAIGGGAARGRPLPLHVAPKIPLSPTSGLPTAGRVVWSTSGPVVLGGGLKCGVRGSVLKCGVEGAERCPGTSRALLEIRLSPNSGLPKALRSGWSTSGPEVWRGGLKCGARGGVLKCGVTRPVWCAGSSGAWTPPEMVENASPGGVG